MRKRKLGQSKVEITPIILGTWAIGGWMWGGSEEGESIAAIHASIDAEITTIDTAPIYGMGYSEEIVGKAITGKRDNVVIATKCGMRWKPATSSVSDADRDPFGNPVEIYKSLKSKSIFEECEASLRRLKTDVIDLYQIHWPDISTPLEESWEAMAKLKEQGKVRAIGVSNFSLEQLKKAHQISPVDSIQPPYSLIRRGIEEEILPFCQKNEISILAYSPMERGLLTGKIGPGQAFAPNDHRSQKDSFKPENIARVNSALEKIRPIATQHGATLAQIIIHCTYTRPGITAALIGARRPAQAIENAGAMRLCLSEDEKRAVIEALEDKKLQRPIYDS